MTVPGSSLGGVSFSMQGAGIIGTILVIQLVLVARRLLRSGYPFEDIRTVLLAEAQVQAEEADETRSGRSIRRLNNLWRRLRAGRFGRFFFRGAGTMDDLTTWLERARATGEAVDRRLAADGEVRRLLRP